MRHKYLKDYLIRVRAKALAEGVAPKISFAALCDIMERHDDIISVVKDAQKVLRRTKGLRKDDGDLIEDLQNQLREWEENTVTLSFEPVSIGFNRPSEGEDLQRELAAMLNKDNKKMRKAGNRLAIAATRVIDTHDGLHRLALELKAWFTVIAEEGNRDRFNVE